MTGRDGQSMNAHLVDSSPAAEAGMIPHRVMICLFGKFRIEVNGVPLVETAWQNRRMAKALIKLLATESAHTLPRDQILDILWPEADLTSAVNSFYKALHAARHALEPQLPNHGRSAYIHLQHDTVTLDTQHIWIDMDHFQFLANRALRVNDDAAYEEAIAAYTGEFLPEDRYESWIAQKRVLVNELYIDLLVRFAESLQRQGAFSQATGWLQRMLRQDETREDIHRQLMRLYVAMGNRSQALQQYERCREILHSEIETEPDPETERLYQEIRASRLDPPSPVHDLYDEVVAPAFVTTWQSMSTRMVGRETEFHRLVDEVNRAESGKGGMVLVTGKEGIGKSRLIAELALVAANRGHNVLWGTSGVQGNLMPYSPMVEALEGYVASQPHEECADLAQRYPELVPLIPSLSRGMQRARGPAGGNSDSTYLFSAIVRMLTDLSWTRPVLLVLTGLHEADSPTIQLLQYLARLGSQRRWLIVGTYREESLSWESPLQRMLLLTSMERFYHHITLQRLTRPECDQLVTDLLSDGVPDEVCLEEVYTLTGGNPLFVEGLIHAAREKHTLVLESGGWRKSGVAWAIPRHIRNLVAQHAAHLDEDMHLVLFLITNLGLEFTLEELQTEAALLNAPLPDEMLLQVLDRILGTGIVEEQQDKYAFRYPIVYLALEQYMVRNRPHHLRWRIQRATASRLSIAGA